MPLELKLKQGVIAAGIFSFAVGASNVFYNKSLGGPFETISAFAMYGSSIGLVDEINSLRTEKHIADFFATPLQSAGSSGISYMLGYVGAKIIEEYMGK